LTGTSNTAGALLGAGSAALAPLLGGQIVALLGYGWLFGLSAAVALLAVLTLGDGARAPARRPA
jgi:MFS family permease